MALNNFLLYALIVEHLIGLWFTFHFLIESMTAADKKKPEFGQAVGIFLTSIFWPVIWVLSMLRGFYEKKEETK